jgi:NAD kinase
MQRLTENKIVLVRRKTRLEELVARYNTVDQAQFHVESLGEDFGDYQEENKRYASALRTAEASLETLGRLQVVPREFLPNFSFGKQDVVVAIGQDGLVANTLKYLDGQVLVGVNPDPLRWDGVLLPFSVGDLRSVITDVFSKRRHIREVSMAQACLNDGQRLLAVNDLFIGRRTHVSARYRLQQGGVQECQSSSGIIVSTGLGSTGWLRSVVAGASSVVRALSGGELQPLVPVQSSWDSKQLIYSVREPFPSRSSDATMVFGAIVENDCLSIVSQMPEDGVIFSDGIESDYLEFSSGLEARISLAERRGLLVV